MGRQPLQRYNSWAYARDRYRCFIRPWCSGSGRGNRDVNGVFCSGAEMGNWTDRSKPVNF